MNIPVGAGFACPNGQGLPARMRPQIKRLMYLGGQTTPLRLNERPVVAIRINSYEYPHSI